MSRAGVVVVVVIVALLLLVRCELLTDQRPVQPGCVDAVTVNCREAST